MCDAAEPESGQGGSGLGLPLAGPRGHRLGPGRFHCMEGKEDDIASTNSSKNVCPPHSSQRAPVSTWVRSHPPGGSPPWLPPDSEQMPKPSPGSTRPCMIWPVTSLSSLSPALSLFPLAPQTCSAPHCCYLSTLGPCLRAFALAVPSAWSHVAPLTHPLFQVFAQISPSYHGDYFETYRNIKPIKPLCCVTGTNIVL